MPPPIASRGQECPGRRGNAEAGGRLPGSRTQCGQPGDGEQSGASCPRRRNRPPTSSAAPL
eukprot:15476725-Alexandrium_andersonii.AAC.1